MKDVLLTGDSRGIGLAIAEKLLDEGFQVTGTARKSAFPEQLEKHQSFRGLHADLSMEDDLNRVIRPVFDGRYPPSILINNAGISEPCHLGETDEEWKGNWNRTLTVNLFTMVGHIWCKSFKTGLIIVG